MKIRIALRHVLLVFPVAPLASACTVRMMNGSSVAQDPQIAFFGKRAVGEFLCLSSVPNELIYSRPGPGAGILGCTRTWWRSPGCSRAARS